MARLEDLEFRITATTDSLRTDLAKSSAQIDTFVRRTESSFGMLNTRFATVGRTLRTTFAFFGVSLGASMFANWISGAVKAADQAGVTARKLDELRESWNKLGVSIASSQLGKSVTQDLTNLAEGLRKAIDPTELEQARAAYDKLKAQSTPSGRVVGAVRGGRGVAETAAVTQDDLFAALTRLLKAGSADLEQRQTAARIGQLAGSLKIIPTAPDIQLEDIGDVGRLENIGVSARRLPANFQFNEPSALQSITKAADEFERAREANDKLNKSMEESKKRSAEFADNFAAAFESRGIEALLDGDISGAIKGLAKDFAELTLRLAILEPLAKSLFGPITGATGGFFGGLFGAGKASGGPVMAGMAYPVGEMGPELFVPDVPGRILSNAQSRAALSGGGAIYVTQENHISGVEMAKLPAILDANNRRLKAEIQDLRNRNRMS